MSITLDFGTKRRADLDNFNKLSLDALTGVVYVDGSQIADLRVKRRYDKARPRIEVCVRFNALRLLRPRRLCSRSEWRSESRCPW